MRPTRRQTAFARVSRALRAGRLLGLCFALAGLNTAISGAFAIKKRPDQIPWSVRVEVRWGAKKNREVYRGDFERALVADLLSKTCFQKIVAGPDSGEKADLVLEVQLNDFFTEQDYDSPQSLLPGQGEEHRLRSARATIDLGYWLRAEGKDAVDILSGHIFREAVREPQAPTDPAEERALRDLTSDASRWVVREVCERRGRLFDKVSETLGSIKR